MTARAWAAARLCGIVLAALLVGGQLVDIAGRWYLDRYGARVQGIVDSARQHLENRPRLLVSDVPVDQNAAAWYRLAFARLAPASDKTLHMLKQAASRAFEGDSRYLQNLLETRCEEVQRSRVRNALQSPRCGWELSYSWAGSADWDFSTESLNLDSCSASLRFRQAAVQNTRSGVPAANGPGHLHARASHLHLCAGHLHLCSGHLHAREGHLRVSAGHLHAHAGHLHVCSRHL